MSYRHFVGHLGIWVHNGPCDKAEANKDQSLDRSGGSNPGNLTERKGEDQVSFRDSLSNPIDSKERPVFRPGADYIKVDASKLPEGTVVRDGSPPGHVGVQGTTPEQIKAAIVAKGKLPE